MFAVRFWVVLWATAALQATTQAATFQGLGDLTGGNYYSGAYGVDASGRVVAGFSVSANGYEACRWTDSAGMVGLGDLPAYGAYSFGYGISADGSTIVGSVDDGYTQAGYWRGAGPVGIGDLPGGSQSAIANGVSGDGSVIVGDSSSSYEVNTREAFRWTQATGMVGLGYLPGLSGGSAPLSKANAVSTDGSVIVGSSSSSLGGQACRWISGVPSGLGDLAGGSFSSVAAATNSDGSVIVGVGNSPSGFEAMRWTAGGGMVGMGDLPGGSYSSTAWALSADGSIVVGTGNTAAGAEAFIWDQVHGMRNLRQVLTSEYGLNLTGWTLYEARGISTDGMTIVGTGLNPSGNREGWIFRVPEPSSLGLLAVGLCLLLKPLR